MREDLERVAGPFRAMLQARGFRLINSREHSMGALADYESADFRLRFVSDRGFPDIGIGALGTDVWLELNILHLIDEGGDLLREQEPNGLAAWLARRYEFVREMLTKQYQSTADRVAELQHQRARTLWPESFRED